MAGPVSPSGVVIRKWGLPLAAAACSCCCCLTVLVPLYNGAKVASPSTIALNDARQVSLAVAMYSNDFDDRFPPDLSTKGAQAPIEPYLKGGRELALGEAGYTWDQSVEGNVSSDFRDPGKIWLFHTIKPDERDQYDVGFADFHAERIPETDLQKTLGFGHDLAELSSNVHQVWQLPKADSRGPAHSSLQLDLTDPRRYTATIVTAAPSGKTITMFVVRGSYSTGNNQFWIGKRTSVGLYCKFHPGEPWLAAGHMPVASRDEAVNQVKGITVGLLKAGRPVTGKEVIRQPESP